MSDETDFARRSEVAALRRRVAALETAFVRLTARHEHSDAEMQSAFLGAVGPFACGPALGRPWSAAELAEDARRARRMDLLAIIERITGGRGNEVVRLGCWLAGHDGAEAAGFRLVKVRREAGVWLFSVVASVEQP